MTLAFNKSQLVRQCIVYFVYIIALRSPKLCRKYYYPCFTGVRMEALLSYVPKVIKLINDS